MDTRVAAANAILERGMRFRLPAPFWMRWLGRDTVTISHLKAGAILEISKVVIEHHLEEAVAMNNHAFLAQAIEPCARCIAIAILNDRRKIDRHTERWTKRLMWELSDASIVDIFMKVVHLNRVSDFMSITKYLVVMSRTMMNPKNLGQVKLGS